MKRTIYFENIIQDPMESRSSVFSDVFPDYGLSEYAAFKALEYLRESWEEEGREHNRASVDFITASLDDTIKCLMAWKRTWEAVVVADMEADRLRELLSNSDFVGASDSMNKIKAMVQKFNPPDLRQARLIMSREYTKLAELVDASEESA